MSEHTTRVGWIGCGRMGSAMAKRLIAAGYDVSVTNRTISKAEALGKIGATVVENPKDLASRDVVFIMVSANADLLEVTSGPYGVLSDETLAPRIIVDCSTVSSEISAQVRSACEKRGVEFLAAPVSGNPKVVAAGRLTLAVSGTREAFDEARALLDEIGPWRDLRRRRRSGAPRKDLSQHALGHRDPGNGGDHRPRRKVAASSAVTFSASSTIQSWARHSPSTRRPRS